jgi:DNA-binding transcriptional regulator YdaS (Cro superfamily)
MTFAIVLRMKTHIQHPIMVAADLFGTQRVLADLLDIHPSMISQIANGRRKVPARMCRKIELLTGGAVTRYDLRPDIFGSTPESEDSHAA